MAQLLSALPETPLMEDSPDGRENVWDMWALVSRTARKCVTCLQELAVEAPPVSTSPPPVLESEDQTKRRLRNRTRRESAWMFHCVGIFAAVVVRAFTHDNDSWVGQNLGAILVYVVITGGLFVQMLWED